jgi:membrane protein YqaA with SNARE-associated domain
MKYQSLLTIALIASADVTQARGSETHTDAPLPMGLDPAHLHLLTNHMPIFITLSGLLALGMALVWNKDPDRRVALVLLLTGTLGGLMTYWLGQQAYKPVRGLADEVGQDWLDLHMERAEQLIWLFWLAALTITGALVAEWRKLWYALPVTLLAGVLAAVTLALSGWIADAGGKIRHSEIRGGAKVVPDVHSGTAPHEH